MSENRGQFSNTLVVTTANDENDGINNGMGLSLREAVEAANNSAGTDLIVFDSSLSGSNISLSLGEIAIADSVEIVGLGVDTLTIDGANTSRIFNVDDGNAETAIDVRLANLAIANGLSSDTGGSIINQENLAIADSVVTGSTAETRGGAIYNSGNLNVQNSTVSDSQVNQLSGGGIFSNGNLNVQTSTVSGNSAEGNGGGISNFEGTLTIADSLIENNSAVENGAGVANIGEATISNTIISNNDALANGGGILNLDSNLELIDSQLIGNSAESGGGIESAGETGNSNLSVVNSTISGNVANFAGGGIYNPEADDIVVVSNSTLSRNEASYGGGLSNSGTATISSSTISGNTATISGGGIDDYQGSVDVRNSTISNNTADAGAGLSNTYGIEFSVTSSIIAGNSDNNDLSGDSFTSGGNNLIGNGDGAAGFVAGENADLVGNADSPIDPRLGELQNNGGTTETQALLANSPALEAGSNPDNLTFDQRGENFTRTNGAIDIGAFENQSLELEGTNNRDILVGASGDDTIFGLNGNDLLKGELGSDLLFGGQGRDRLFGQGGSDVLNGEENNDFLSGGANDDSLNGGIGRDILQGGNGNDTLDGGNGKDLLFGSLGEDILRGGQGKDFLQGGAGSDRLIGGAGNDILWGGNEDDIFVLEVAPGRDKIIDFQDERDLFALGSDISFEDLRIDNHEDGVMIRDRRDNSAIALVKQVEASNITAEDFTTT